MTIPFSEDCSDNYDSCPFVTSNATSNWFCSGEECICEYLVKCAQVITAPVTMFEYFQEYLCIKSINTSWFLARLHVLLMLHFFNISHKIRIAPAELAAIW